MSNPAETTPANEATAAPLKKRRFGLAALPLLVFGAMAVMFAFALTKGDPSKLPSQLIGKPAPTMQLPPLEGIAGADGRPLPGFASANLARGDVTVVNFFASWCQPCVQEHPYLIALQQRSGVAIHGINHKDPAPGGLRFLARYGNPYAAVGTDGNGRAGIEWGVYGMPETFIIDGQGRIAYKHVGPISQESLERQILPAIAAARKRTAGG